MHQNATKREIDKLSSQAPSWGTRGKRPCRSGFIFMDSTARAASSRATIGIVTGSGPEAGIDLWAKILRGNASTLGAAFRGDLDAPRVVVLSEPQLGLSMDLAANETLVWEVMHQTAVTISGQTDFWAIACNTLNWFAPPHC
jgi:aspartate racemase